MPLSDSGPVGIPEASQKPCLAHTFVPKKDHLFCVQWNRGPQIGTGIIGYPMDIFGFPIKLLLLAKFTFMVSEGCRICLWEMATDIGLSMESLV